MLRSERSTVTAINGSAPNARKSLKHVTTQRRQDEKLSCHVHVPSWPAWARITHAHLKQVVSKKGGSALDVQSSEKLEAIYNFEHLNKEKSFRHRLEMILTTLEHLYQQMVLQNCPQLGQLAHWSHHWCDSASAVMAAALASLSLQNSLFAFCIQRMGSKILKEMKSWRTWQHSSCASLRP